MAVDSKRGEAFIGGGLARAYKEHWDKYLEEHPERIEGPNPWLEKFAAMSKAAGYPVTYMRLVDGVWVDADAAPDTQRDGSSTETESPFQKMRSGQIASRRAEIEAYRASLLAPVCECGVKHTGGLHSDWCPVPNG